MIDLVPSKLNAILESTQEILVTQLDYIHAVHCEGYILGHRADIS